MQKSLEPCPVRLIHVPVAFASDREKKRIPTERRQAQRGRTEKMN
jgi:hypothetical protein